MASAIPPDGARLAYDEYDFTPPWETAEPAVLVTIADARHAAETISDRRLAVLDGLSFNVMPAAPVRRDDISARGH